MATEKQLKYWKRIKGKRAWNYNKQKYYCLICKKEILDSPSKKRKFCSKECEHKYKSICMKGKRPKNYSLFKEQSIGKNHYNWKGDKVSYSSLHHWIRRWSKKPICCSKCGEEGKTIKGKWNIDWSNISGKYLRNLKDYIGLCRDCHMKKDLGKK